MTDYSVNPKKPEHRDKKSPSPPLPGEEGVREEGAVKIQMTVFGDAFPLDND